MSLPPTAAPLASGDLRAALRAPADAPDAFAAGLTRYLDAATCTLAGSGRAALFLLLRALAARAVPSRHEVLMPAYTCPALARVALDLGLRPSLVDVIPETLGMSPDGLRASAGDRTLAIIHVHPFGLSLDVGPALEAAQNVGATVIEDTAQALGASLGARRAGTIGDFGLFSFGPGKPLSTGGGGAVCARGPSGANLLREAWTGLPSAASLPAAARLALLNAVFRPSGWQLATRLGALRFGESEAGLSYTVAGLSAAQAAAGLRALPQLDAANAARRSVGGALGEVLRSRRGLFVPEPEPGTMPVYLRFPLLLPDEAQRDAAYAALARVGLGAGRMYRRTLAEIFPGLGGPYPGAQALAARLLTLPTHAFVRFDHFARIADILSSPI